MTRQRVILNTWAKCRREYDACADLIFLELGLYPPSSLVGVESREVAPPRRIGDLGGVGQRTDVTVQSSRAGHPTTLPRQREQFLGNKVCGYYIITVGIP